MFDFKKEIGNAVFCETEVEYNCDTSGCDEEGICRCRRITQAWLKISTPRDISDIFRELYTGPEDPLEKSLWYWWLKLNAQTFDFNWEAHGSYYGDEGINATLTPSTSFVANFQELSQTDKLKHLLRAEYKTVLPKLDKIKEWEARCVFTGSIKQSNNTNLKSKQVDDYLKVFQSIGHDDYSEFQKNISMMSPLCLPSKDGKHLEIVDGRHRFEAITKLRLKPEIRKKLEVPVVYMWVICPKGTTIV